MKALRYSAVALLLTAAPALASTVTDDFIAAYDKNDPIQMGAVVKKNQSTIPAEVNSIIEKTKALGPEEQESRLYVAEQMAQHYREQTGDAAPLKEVKKAAFESRLSKPVRPAKAEGVYTVELPRESGEIKNIFTPDNIIIKKGETVRWVNNDSIGHLFSTMKFLGMGGILSPKIEPGKSWDYTFDKPGEYFYICFIHQGMIGKVTVEEN